MQQDMEQPQDEQPTPTSFWNNEATPKKTTDAADEQVEVPRQITETQSQGPAETSRATTRAIPRRSKSASRHDLVKRSSGGPKAIRRYQSKADARPQRRAATPPVRAEQNANRPAPSTKKAAPAPNMTEATAPQAAPVSSAKQAAAPQAAPTTATPSGASTTGAPSAKQAYAPKANATPKQTPTPQPTPEEGQIPITEVASEVASQAAEVASTAGNVLRRIFQALGNLIARIREAISSNSHVQAAVDKLSPMQRRVLSIALPVVGVLLVIYVLGGLYFSAHFPPNTKVNGVDVSGMSVPKLQERVQEIGDGYTLTMDGDGINLKASASDIDLGYDSAQYAQAAADQANGWAWPITLLFGNQIEVEQGVSYDEAKLSQVVSSAVTWANKTATYPQDATIAYDKAQGSFVPVQEVAGTAISEEAANTKAGKAVSALNEQVTLGDEDLQKPSITTEQGDFNKLVAEANELASLSIPLRVYNTTVATVDKNLIAGWLTVNNSYQVETNIEAITDWARGDFSSQVDTVGTTRSYTRADGKEIQIAGGTYGWSVDGASLAKLIADRIVKKSSDPIDVPMLSEAAVLTKGGADWGNRYIDVDLTEQYVRMYDTNGNCIWESQCVSGDASQDQETIMGVYAIEGKESPAKLIGLDYDGDGEPDYETDVNYWMPFCGGYGLHDATWRYDFGGDIFQYEGSHGCINLPFDFAAVLYDLVNIGDPVVVHW